jgi:hypothetical protein
LLQANGQVVRADPAWFQVSASTGQSIVLRADRFQRRELQNTKAKEECMGINVNIGNRVKIRSYYLDEIHEIRCI